MAKIFNTSEDIVSKIEDVLDETGLTNYGLNFKFLSLTKAKDILKVSKANATTEFLTNKDSMIYVFVYEAAFDKLNDDTQKMLIDMALSNVSIDLDKDKITIESNPFTQIFAMRQKYGDTIFLNALETSYAVIKEIEEIEKREKEMAKEAKKNKHE